MKLRNIYFICRDNYDAIKGLTAKDVSINNRAGKGVIGWELALKALLNTKKVPSLEEDSISLIEAIPELNRTQDSFNISIDDWSLISIAKSTLLRNMDDVINLYEKMGLETEVKIGLDIKLPSFNDFSEFVKYLNDIEFVFSKCPFLQHKEEKLMFDNVDIGTTWLTFFITGSALVGGSVLLNNIAAFIDKCIVIRSHYLSTQKQKYDLEKENKDDDEKKVILNYVKQLYKRQFDAVIQELEKVTNYTVENKDGDEYGRIEDCFERMGSMLDKGLQIYSTIDSPKEVKALFEPLEMKYLSINDALKLLEEKED